MNKYKYYFDWQESTIYEGIEARNKMILAADIANLVVDIPKKLQHKNSKHRSVNIIFPNFLP